MSQICFLPHFKVASFIKKKKKTASSSFGFSGSLSISHPIPLPFFKTDDWMMALTFRTSYSSNHSYGFQILISRVFFSFFSFLCNLCLRLGLACSLRILLQQYWGFISRSIFVFVFIVLCILPLNLWIWYLHTSLRVFALFAPSGFLYSMNFRSLAVDMRFSRPRHRPGALAFR